ncbi:MAG TPA: MOP flippase family protein [Pyrinomonadaceae bacterium]|nr:MOP flippase family protein [Pyrinomonadaceae bacterium]
MSLTKKVISGVSWSAVAQIGQRATSLVVTAILARQLSPEDFGLIALTLLAVNFFTYFHDMGLSSALVQRAELREEHLTTAFWLNIGAGIILALIGVALSRPIAMVFREPRVAPLLKVLMVTFLINGFGWVSYALLQRKFKFREIAIIESGGNLVAGITGITLALAGAGVWALVAQQIAMSLMLTCGRLFTARWSPRFRFSFQSARELFSFSLSALGYFVVSHGVRSVDNAFVGAVLGATALGYYALAYNLILMPGMTICVLIGRVMFPVLSSVQDDMVRFRQAYLRMARTVTSATFPLIIGLGSAAPLFVTTIYGEKWAAVVPVLRILIVIGFFEATGFWGVAVWALGKTKITFILALVSLILMTVAFSIGVRWGLLGVAWAYVIISPVIFILPHMLASRLMKLRLGDYLGAIAPPLFASLVMGFIIALSIERGIQLFASRWLNLLAYITAGACIYSTVLIGIAIVNKGERGIISWLMGRHLSELEGQPQNVH